MSLKNPSKMTIVIPTMNRSRIITLEELRRCGYFGEIVLVVPVNQVKNYKTIPDTRVIGLPIDYRIAETRQFIVNQFGPKVVMMDDDLRFYERVQSSDRPIPLKKAENVTEMIESLDRTLDRYAHCSVSSRTQNAQISRSDDSRYVENTRPYRIYAYRTDVLKNEKIGYSTGMERFTMDDFYMTLALLTKGYAISIDCRFAHEQISSNSAGGASSYRTLQTHENSAVTLARKFPGFVKVVKKSTTSSWGGTKENPVERSDVVIQWKKAYLSAVPKSVSRL